MRDRALLFFLFFFNSPPSTSPHNVVKQRNANCKPQPRSERAGAGLCYPSDVIWVLSEKHQRKCK